MLIGRTKNAVDVAMDLRVWIVLAIVTSLLIKPLDIDSSMLIIITLMIQMTLALDGLSISKKDIMGGGRNGLLSIFLCYVMNTAVTLACGLFFIKDNPDIWHGWVMLASMPCAISVVTAAVLVKGNLNASLIGVTATYTAGIVLTPLISFAILGNAVNPFEILKYILLFILIPVILARLLSVLHLKRTVKVPVINLMMFIMVFLAVNANHEFIMNFPELILVTAVIVVVRVAALHLITAVILRKIRTPEMSYTVFLVMGVWKNTGLSVSMSMLLLAPEAVIPCFLSLIVESLWFSLVTNKPVTNPAEPVA